MNRERRLSLRRAIPLAVVVAGGLLALTLFRDALDMAALRAHRAELIAWREANTLSALLAYMGAYVAVVALSLPGGAVMTMTGGFLFGVAAGTAAAVAAATAGATILFLAARAGLGEALHERILARSGEGSVGRIARGLRENEVSYLLVMRLVPAIPFFVANLAPAFLGVSLRNFVLTTFVGIMPGTAVYAWIGAGLGEVLARGEAPDPGLLFEPVVLGPILGLAALAALPIIIRALRARREGNR